MKKNPHASPDSLIGQPSAPRTFIILLALVLLTSFGLRLIFLQNLRWTYDEGLHILFVQMLARGYAPYSEVFVSYPPLYTLSMDWTWRLFGTIESLQLLMTLYTMTGLLGIALLAWRLGGLWAGLLASIFMSLEPEFFRGSRAVLTEVPSVSVATLAITLAAYYLWGKPQQRGWGWLAASGVILAFSLMLKILSPFVLGLIPLMILVRHLQLAATTPWQQQLVAARFWRAAIRDGLIWSAALFVPLVALTLLYDVPALFNQAITFRFATRSAYEGEDINLLVMWSALQANWPISLLALPGVWVLWRYRWRTGWFVLVWLGLAVIFGLMQVPLREKHLPLLLPPLSILAGLGAVGLATWSRTWRPHRPLLGWTPLLLLVGLLLGYGWQAVNMFTAYSASHTQYLNQTDEKLVTFIKKFTAPNDCIVTDDPTLAFFANRPVPPNLAEVSSARLRSGDLSYEDLVEATSSYNCQIVAPVAERLKRTRPDFVEWSKQNFMGMWLYDGETEILLAQPLDDPQPDLPVGKKLGEQVELIGGDVIHQPAQQTIHVSLYWQVLQPLPEDYTIFVHLRDGANNTVVNGDHQPYNNRIPTSHWLPGQIIKETIRLDVPPDLPAGRYPIFVGLYDPATGQRLPIQQDASGENAVVIPESVIIRVVLK